MRSTAERSARLSSAARTIFIAVLGALAILAGLALLVLPGPGSVLIVFGLHTWGRRFGWARRVSDWVLRHVRAIRRGSSEREGAVA